ncbi:hypothetical protein [Mycolicibacterium frederiksbergense]|uniref:Uncharacterized protein n=1 Tax=Mycolicibacterium frederiksbergense TaxID=117567 RepID=A0A6H0S077_9MYCO|nr:hypothetical protein [Mycolicibacterium frederiksbergense]QIV79879.1 hypothetical protein EXE63_02415 [Mycolicibacterium frederiksbergense]
MSLEDMKASLVWCVENGEPFTPAARSALIEAYKTANHATVAERIGVMTNVLIARLRASAEVVTGVDKVRVGDLILELDGDVTSLVVRREFGPLYEGGPKCLGIHGWTPPREYNLWENTDIEYPERTQMVLLRAVPPSSN